MCAPLAFGDQSMEQYFQTFKRYYRYFEIAWKLAFICGKDFSANDSCTESVELIVYQLKLFLNEQSKLNLRFCLSLLNHEKW